MVNPHDNGQDHGLFPSPAVIPGRLRWIHMEIVKVNFSTLVSSFGSVQLKDILYCLPEKDEQQQHDDLEWH